MTREEKLKLNRDRQKAVRDAWKREVELVKQEKGTVDWSKEQQMELLEKGKVSGYEGQHMKSVNEYPEYAASSDNIQFLSHDAHLAAHNSGSEKSGYHSPTNGFYDTNTGIMHDFGNNPPHAPEAFLLSNPIAHDDLKILNGGIDSKIIMKENGDEMTNDNNEFNKDLGEDGSPVKVLKSYGNDTSISSHDYEQELYDIDKGISNAYEPYNDELSAIQNKNDEIMNDESLSNQEKISELKSNRQEVENIGKSWSEESKEYYDNRENILGKMSGDSTESANDIYNVSSNDNSKVNGENSLTEESELGKEKSTADEDIEAVDTGDNEENAFDEDFEAVDAGGDEESAFDEDFESVDAGGNEESAFDEDFESVDAGGNEESAFDEDFEAVDAGGNEESAFDEDFEAVDAGGNEENAFDDGLESSNDSFSEQNTFDDSFSSSNTGSGVDLESNMDREM